MANRPNNTNYYGMINCSRCILEDGLQRLKIIVIPPPGSVVNPKWEVVIMNYMMYVKDVKSNYMGEFILPCPLKAKECFHQGAGRDLHIYGPLARPRLLDLAEGVMLIHVYCPLAMSHGQRTVWNPEDTHTFMLHQGLYLNNTEVCTVLAALPPVLIVKPTWSVHLVKNFICLTEIYCNYSVIIQLSDVIKPDTSIKNNKICIFPQQFNRFSTDFPSPMMVSSPCCNPPTHTALSPLKYLPNAYSPGICVPPQEGMMEVPDISLFPPDLTIENFSQKLVGGDKQGTILV
ncbi:hypothetical protein CDAR_216951 [Caerostris darwini]|uniref:Uncharacterized protein n=1 Tax=Caerostris darwini TaxID=1538125 RepID=A0AAV4UTP9_9ARAC|nr:hypothetical protein CDAR_216951 [Caerostris darwini]